MGDMGSNQPPPWRPSGHMMYQPMREEEPSSSIPSSSSSSFMQSLYRGQDMFNSNRFAPSYDIQGASVSSQMFPPPESSFQSNSFRDLSVSRNEAQVPMPSFNTMDTANQSFNNQQSVASSSVCDTGYPMQQLIVDAQNRIVAVQRSLSPDVDSTVSQSGNRQLPLQDRGASGQRSMMDQLRGNNVPNIRHSQSEVSTSGEPSVQGSRGHHHRDRRNIGQGRSEVDTGSPVRSAGRGNVYVMESAVSSLTGSTSNEAEVTHRQSGKVPRRTMEDIVSGEPDTTQTEEEQTYTTLGKGFNDGSPTINRNNLRNNLIPLDNRQQPSSSNNMADSTQMMTMRPQVSQSGNTGITNISNSFIPGIMSNGYLGQIPPPPQLPAGEIPLSQFTTSELAASASQLVSSMESQLNQGSYNMGQGIDTSTKLNTYTSDINSSYSNYMSTSDNSAHQEPQPGTSAEGSQNRRKSSRIAELESEAPLVKKVVYEPRPYNPKELWCEDCMRGYDIECDIHRLLPVQDKVVFSRAWASLPQGLQIFRIEDDNNELGVFSKRPIFKRTQFGPFVAELVESEETVTEAKFPLMVERDGTKVYYEMSDENMCNWMMFVRPARNFAEQNVVAYQHGNDIYFSVSKDISEPKMELKVWYARHYAERWNKPFYEATEEDLQAMEEELCKFPCYECTKKFRTAAALQKHLITHDSDPLKDGVRPDPSEILPPFKQRRRKAYPTVAVRRKLLTAKSTEENGDTESNGSAPAVYHWKKRSTNIYLNKTLKKYQKWHGDVFRKSTQNYVSKPDMIEDTMPDLECIACELTFSNITLLNMHLLSHNEEEIDDSKFAFQLESMGLQLAPSSQIQVNCPGCSRQFYNKRDLIHHVAEHGAPKSDPNFSIADYHPDIMNPPSPSRGHRCNVCFKTFTTLDRLAKHHLCHGDEANKPFQCNVCLKRFINNSAISCHMKTHSTAKYYQCPICHIGFDHTSAMREHSQIHANANGTFNCPHCDKVFLEFLVLKKHVRGFHTNRSYPCTECDKVFPRQDKLRLHMLRHSTIKEFMCDTCGRQFKRKDKLKEHIKRMHSADRAERDRLKALRPTSAKKFIPKVAPTEFHRFIYKCHICMLGFKRRGMLVNHIAKRHPSLKPESVPELNLPILKTQRDYYCQYCDKVYKSSSKRKAHILKNHPGSELPQSARKKSSMDEIPGVPNPTYSQTVGSITTMPHQCIHCHKQYASKAKLLQHQRKQHPEMVPPLSDRIKKEALILAQGGDSATYVIEKVAEDTDAQAADLLTQAMTELTQSVEFRQISGSSTTDSSFLSTRLGQGGPTMVQIQTSGGEETQTIELTQLSQALQQFAPPQGHLPINVHVSTAMATHIALPITTTSAAAAAAAAAVAAAGAGETETSPSSPTTILTVEQTGEATAEPTSDSEVSITQANTATTSQAAFPPISIVSGTYIPKSWTYSFDKPS